MLNEQRRLQERMKLACVDYNPFLSSLTANSMLVVLCDKRIVWVDDKFIRIIDFKDNDDNKVMT